MMNEFLSKDLFQFRENQPMTTSPSAVTWSPQAVMEPPSTVMPSRLTFKVSLQRFPPSRTLCGDSSCSNSLSKVSDFLKSITAMYMTVGAIVAAVNAKHEEKKSKRIIDVVSALVFVTGILFAARRGSFLAIVLILAYIYFDTSKSKASRVLLLIVGALLLLYFGIDKIPGMQGMLDKFSRLSGNMMNGRQNICKIALNNLCRHPLFGYGVGRANVTGGGGSVDNAYIAVLVERGIIGMIVFFIPYIHTLVQTYSRRKKCGAASKSLETSFYFQLLFIIMSVMENYYGQALSMFVYFLMVFSAQFDDQREKK